MFRVLKVGKTYIKLTLKSGPYVTTVTYEAECRLSAKVVSEQNNDLSFYSIHSQVPTKGKIYCTINKGYG